MKVEIEFPQNSSPYYSLVVPEGEKGFSIRFEGSKETLELKNVISFPGLVNAHDHLEFNLFPFLSNKVYKDYTEWGGDIHRNNSTEIKKILNIPVELRIKWGVLKNLLSGVTNIIHHGEYHPFIKNLDYPVYLNYQFLHSIANEPWWKLKLNLSLRKDVMIHIGEGVESSAHDEISKITKWNLLKRNLVGIHGIAMDTEQSKKFRSLIWCPCSNLKLYGKTAQVDQLKKHTTILFGTDSTVSASPNIWEQLRLARSLKLLNDEEIFDTVTKNPYSIFPTIRRSSQVIARKKEGRNLDSFFDVNPQDLLLVLIDGKVVLADEMFTDFMKISKYYAPVKMSESKKWVKKEWADVVTDLEKLNVSLTLPVRSLKNSRPQL